MKKQQIIRFAIATLILPTLVAVSIAQEKSGAGTDNYRPGSSLEDRVKLEQKAAAHKSVDQTPNTAMAPPGNDNFSNAQNFTGTGGFLTTNLEATGEAGEPFHGAGAGGGSPEQNNSVWFKRVAEQTGVLRIWTQSTAQMNLQDTVLSAYTGSAVNPLTPLAECDDFPGMNLYSEISFSVVAGQTYYIAVDGFGAQTGNFFFAFQLSSAAANDNFANSKNISGDSFSPYVGVTGSNVGATSEVGEPAHNDSSGPNNSIWYSWTPFESQSITFVTNGSAFDTILAVYTGSAVNGLTLVAVNDDFGTNGTLSSRVTFFATAGVTYRIAIDGFSSFTGNTLLNWSPNREENRRRFDFNGDQFGDISIFRPSNGQWWINRSNSSVIALTFGQSSDRIVPADYTGDTAVDVAVWRPSNGTWYVLRSQDFSFYAFPFGTTGDIPVAGQFDRDSSADPVIFRPSTATFYVKRSYTGVVDTIQFGTPGDVPVVADYDGDGRSDLAIYRPSNGQWWLNRSTSGVIATTFGVSTDKPTIGDYTGDGRTDIAFWRPSSGEWYILRSEDFSYYSLPFGTSTDVPAPADYDGDAKFDPTVFRPSSATWYIQRSNGAGTLIVPFGSNGDRPTANSYVP